MKEYNKYENENELLADINLALENLKEYLVKIDSPISKYNTVIDLQNYIKKVNHLKKKNKKNKINKKIDELINGIDFDNLEF